MSFIKELMELSVTQPSINLDGPVKHMMNNPDAEYDSQQISKDPNRMELDPDLADERDEHGCENESAMQAVLTALLDFTKHLDKNGSKDLEYGDLAMAVTALRDQIQNKMQEKIPDAKSEPSSSMGGESSEMQQ